MKFLFTKKAIVVVLVLVVLAVGAFVFTRTEEPEIIEPIVEEVLDPRIDTIGTSVEGRKIESYTYGDGDTHLAFVGGIHGGYEWNSVILAYRFIDYFDSTPEAIPDNLTVSIIPSANPDGLHLITGKEGRIAVADIPAGKDAAPGRFNANNVDLNRNFDCNWKSEGVWRGAKVGTGSGPFSEPEALAIKNFVENTNPDAVVFWHSQANTVYASECNNGVLPETKNIMNAYATASGYNAVESFDAYEVNGDAEGWLAKINIPALTVELKTHETIEWEKNLAGVKALFGYYAQR